MAVTNPRRTSTMTPPSSSGPVNSTSRNLRKGATFHSPPTSPLLERPFNIPSLPRRSETTLDDVIDAHKRRMALTLDDLDRSLSSLTVGSPSSSSQSFADDGLPVPSGVLRNTVASPSGSTTIGPIMTNNLTEVASIDTSARSLRPRRQVRRIPSYKFSDSESDNMSGSDRHSTSTGATSVSNSPAKAVATGPATTRSAAVAPTALPRLSARANNKIHEHIFRPILSKASLRDFHPIIKDCPRRIHNKEIVCLRDLEKTLIFLAPERSKTAELYLEFCTTSIRCIQATVEYLSEREQTRPNERPYTNGYFIDLVDQIKNYAQQVQQAKEKESKGEVLDEMDPQSTDEIKLYGGLTRNGRPAELVRVKPNGDAISIATGLPIKMESIEEDEKGGFMMKRSLSMQDDDDESILRSMARRKRSASALPPPPKVCREPGCGKEFARPCDLTKHEKTHSRPWKCAFEDCKYHEYGWPTEKELDRHVNDKHATSPKLYKCHFTPCPYKSKRESNCKQHMEKAHNWTYVRTKNNGRKTAPSVAGSDKSKAKATLPTPQTMMHTPESVDPFTPSDDEEMIYGNDKGPVFDFHGAGVFADQSDFPDLLTGDHTTGMNPYISPVMSNLHSSTGTSPFVNVNNNFGDNVLLGTTGADFPLYGDEDIYTANAVHLPPTPTHDIYTTNYVDSTFRNFTTNNAQQISPTGHDQMLYTPPTLIEDSFDYSPSDQMDTGDFQLFANTTTINHNTFTGGNFVGEVPSAIANFAPNSQEFFQNFYQTVENTGMEIDWTQSHNTFAHY